jgi:sugar phosphate isomerase/epimerase
VKIGLSSITFRHLPLGRFLEISKELDFENIDIAGIPGWAPHLNFPSIADADIKGLLEDLERLNLKVSSFNVGGDIASPVYSEKSVEFIQSAIRVANRINVPIITVGAGFKGGVKNLSINNVRKLIKFSEDYGVTFTLELPHLGTLAEKWKEALTYLNEIPELPITLDTSHLYISGGTIMDIEPFIDRIKHIHLRDAKGSDISYVPGEGEFDFKRFFKLVKSKYSGVYVLELEVHETSPDAIANKVKSSKTYIIKVFQL